MISVSTSNLGWLKTEDASVADTLAKQEVMSVDLAMGRYFPSPHQVSEADWVAVAGWWTKRGFSISSLQSLLFGAGNLNIFSSQEERTELLRILELSLTRAERIGVRRVIFGSPRQRLRLSNSDEELEIALHFFDQVGELASRVGVKFLIEPNSSNHGCNFLTNGLEALQFVSQVDSDGLGVNLDLGAETLASLEAALDSISHFGYVHVSNERLEPLNESKTWVDKLELVKSQVPVKTLAIEQLASSDRSNLDDLSQSVDLLKEVLT